MALGGKRSDEIMRPTDEAPWGSRIVSPSLHVILRTSLKPEVMLTVTSAELRSMITSSPGSGIIPFRHLLASSQSPLVVEIQRRVSALAEMGAINSQTARTARMAKKINRTASLECKTVPRANTNLGDASPGFLRNQVECPNY